MPGDRSPTAGQIGRSGSENVRPSTARGRRTGTGTATSSPGGSRKAAPCSTGNGRRPPLCAGRGSSAAGSEKTGSPRLRRSRVMIPVLHPGPCALDRIAAPRRRVRAPAGPAIGAGGSPRAPPFHGRRPLGRTAPPSASVSFTPPGLPGASHAPVEAARRFPPSRKKSIDPLFGRFPLRRQEPVRTQEQSAIGNERINLVTESEPCSRTRSRRHSSGFIDGSRSSDRHAVPCRSGIRAGIRNRTRTGTRSRPPATQRYDRCEWLGEDAPNHGGTETGAAFRHSSGCRVREDRGGPRPSGSSSVIDVPAVRCPESRPLPSRRCRPAPAPRRRARDRPPMRRSGSSPGRARSGIRPPMLHQAPDGCTFRPSPAPRTHHDPPPTAGPPAARSPA